MNQRGPDYADQLSTSEQATLDRLLAEVSNRRRRGLGAPLAAGLAAALILLAVASILTVVRTTQPRRPQEAASATTGAGTLWDQLADAAGSHTGSDAGSPIPGSAPTPHPGASPQLRLEVSITKKGSTCGVTATAVSTRVNTAAPWPQPLLGRVRVSLVSPPQAATNVAGCDETSPLTLKQPAEVADSAKYGKDMAIAWRTMLQKISATQQLPPYVDLRALADQAAIDKIPATPDRVLALLNGLSAVGEPDTAEARWWALWVDLIASDLTTPAQRAAAFRAASVKAADPSGQVRPTDTADVTGRPGITIQVPYLRGPSKSSAVAGLEIHAAVACLTFDPSTGALSQRVVVYPVNQVTRYEITAYAISDTGPSMAWVRQVPSA